MLPVASRQRSSEVLKPLRSVGKLGLVLEVDGVFALLDFLDVERAVLSLFSGTPLHFECRLDFFLIPGNGAKVEAGTAWARTLGGVV